jgi:flavin reductase
MSVEEVHPTLPIDLFRRAFRRYANGVTVLTYSGATGTHGMTATSVCSLAAQPPQLMVCVNRAARTRDLIVEAGRFAVNILNESQRDLSELCSTAGGDKALDASVTDPESAFPFIRTALASLGCHVIQVHEGVTHSMIVGEVDEVCLGRQSPPLVYFEGTYNSVRTLTGGGQVAPMYEQLFDDMIRSYS